MPESIFANTEFLIEVKIIPDDAYIADINLRIIAPNEKVTNEYKIPFKIIVKYTNDIGK